MDLRELNRHFELVEKLHKAQEMLTSLRERAHPSAGGLTGMPHAPGVKNRVADLAIEIADLSSRIDWLVSVVHEDEKTIKPFIDSIDDETTWMIFRLRFLRGLEWQDVAAGVGGRNTAESVKMICYRFLDDKSVP